MNDKIDQAKILAASLAFLKKEVENLENRLNESISGISGPEGERGPRGWRGPIGEEGPEGLQGIQGEKGIQGEIGKSGEEGPMGLTGPQGEQGLLGEQGEQGIQGERGPKGQRGPEGKVALTEETQLQLDSIMNKDAIKQELKEEIEEMKEGLFDYVSKSFNNINKAIVSMGIDSIAGGGETRFGNLDDVDTSGLVQGAIPTYDANSGKFILDHRSVIDAASLLSMTDVDATNISDRSMLMWDSSVNKFILGQDPSTDVDAAGDPIDVDDMMSAFTYDDEGNVVIRDLSLEGVEISGGEL